MTADKILDVAITVLEFGHTMSETQVDDEVLELLRILRRNAEFIAWANKWIPTRADIPEGAATVQDVPQRIESILDADKLGKLVSLLTLLVQVYKTLYPKQPPAAAPTQS